MIGKIYVRLLPFDTEPKIEGYKAHEDIDISLKFPNCCDFHRDVNKSIHDNFEKNASIYLQWYEKEYNIEIDRTIYKNTPAKILKQLSYTEFFISEKITSNLWLEDITNYIEYNIQSFGDPSPGVTWYVSMVRLYLKEFDKNIEKNKKDKIITFLNSKMDSLTGKENETYDSSSIRIHATVQKWLKLLPFKIKELSKISKDYKWLMIPSIDNLNPYSGLSEMRKITVSELIKLLNNFTRTFIQGVDSTYLKKNGNLDDINKHHEGLTDFEYKFKKEKIVGDFSSEENVYVEILEKWINTEIVYIEKIKAQIRNGDLILKEPKDLDGIYTFKTTFTESQLDEMRLKLITKGYISKISKDDFLYLFSNQLIKGKFKKLIWKMSKSKAHYFFSKVVYSNINFSSSQVNRFVSFRDGTKISSNNKTGEFQEIDLLLPN